MQLQVEEELLLERQLTSFKQRDHGFPSHFRCCHRFCLCNCCGKRLLLTCWRCSTHKMTVASACQMDTKNNDLRVKIQSLKVFFLWDIAFDHFLLAAALTQPKMTGEFMTQSMSQYPHFTRDLTMQSPLESEGYMKIAGNTCT